MIRCGTSSRKKKEKQMWSQCLARWSVVRALWFTAAYTMKYDLVTLTDYRWLSRPQRQHTCSFMRVQADELDGALVWRSAGFTVLHMLSSWTVPEGMAVSYKVHLDTHTQTHRSSLVTHTSGQSSAVWSSEHVLPVTSVLVLCTRSRHWYPHERIRLNGCSAARLTASEKKS